MINSINKEKHLNDNEVKYCKETPYHYLAITETEFEGSTIRVMQFSSSHQSAVYLDDNNKPDYTRVPYRYEQQLELLLAYRPDVKKVLVIGLGGGTIIERWSLLKPGLVFDAIELDPAVVDVAYSWFNLKNANTILTGDGRHELKNLPHNDYDLIILDTYHSNSVPFHLMTQEFAAELQNYISPTGIVALNLIGHPEGKWFQTIHATWAQKWPRVRHYLTREPRDQTQNIVLLLSNSDWPTENELIVSADKLMRENPESYSNFDLRSGLTRIDKQLVLHQDAIILTDDYAPMDALLKYEEYQ